MKAVHALEEDEEALLHCELLQSPRVPRNTQDESRFAYATLMSHEQCSLELRMSGQPPMLRAMDWHSVVGQ